MQPEIDLLGLPLKTFGLMFALGFLAAGAMITRRLRELGRGGDWSYEIVFAALIGGLVGANARFSNFPEGLIGASSFPVGTIVSSTASGNASQ